MEITKEGEEVHTAISKSHWLIRIKDENNDINLKKKHLEKSIPTAGHYLLQNGIHSQKSMVNLIAERRFNYDSIMLVTMVVSISFKYGKFIYKV